MSSEPKSEISDAARALINMETAFGRADYEGCIKLLVRIPAKTAEHQRGFSLAAQSCAALVRAGGTADGARNFSGLMEYVATSGDLWARSLIEQLFERELVEPDARVVLSTIVMVRATPAMNRLMASAKAQGRFRSTFAGASFSGAPDELEKFMAAALGELTGPVVVGAVQYSERVATLGKEAFIGELCQILNSPKMGDKGIDGELEGQSSLLHIVACLCRQFHDESADFLALHFVIQFWAVRGEPQRARDLAETGLQSLRFTQPSELSYRTCLAWLCWAEAWARSHQPLKAVQALAYALMVSDTHPWAAEWALRFMWLAARILRELGAPPLARQLLESRRILIESLLPKASPETFLESDVAFLQVDLMMADDVASYQEILSRAVQLLRRTNDNERPSIVSAAVNAVRILRGMGQSVDSAIQTEIADSLACLPAHIKKNFEMTLTENVGTDNLREIARTLPAATHPENAGAAVFPLLGLCYVALERAVMEGNRELFVLAASILSQPSLALREEAEHSPTDLQEWRELLQSASPDPAKLSAAYVKSGKPTDSYSVRSISDVTVDTLCATIDENVDGVVIALNERHALYTLAITDCNVGLPRKESPETWTPAAYERWREDYPFGYGKWVPTLDPFASDGLSIFEVIASVQRLEFNVPAGYRHLVLFPTAQLFGFPFNLIPERAGCALILSRPVSIAPSIAWLGRCRDTPWTGTDRRTAWLGWSESHEMNLEIIRAKLAPALQSHRIDLLSDREPAGAAGTALAIVASHGGLGSNDFFQSVSDRSTEFSAHEFAAHFQGCGCVVLLVCSAGSMAERRASPDSHGLVSELLAVGVRTVVACPWPLVTDTAVQWTGPFVDYLSKNFPVAEAAWAANRMVGIQLDHPCAWAAMHVFGDGSYRIP